VATESGQENPALMSQLVVAIRGLNKAELLAQGREYKMRRTAGRRPLVDLVDRDTGEVLDEFPPEAVLRMMAALEKEREEEEL
jgi:uncharacterized FlaG/YvyC family protein